MNDTSSVASANPHRDGHGGGTSKRSRVVLFGMRCAFTLPVLTALAESPAVQIEAVILPRSATSPSLTPDPALDTVQATKTPVIEVSHRSGLASPEFRATMERIAPDAIIAACFPWRLPRWLRSLPPGGCLNVHPSLLPDGRGPEPVFWAFRWGLTATGVTLHVMDEGFDTGPVVAQRRVANPDGATIPGLERMLAEIGAGMVVEHLSMSRDEPVVPIPQPQVEEMARYARIPGPEDLIVPTSWAVSDAARFIRAAAPVYGTIPILVLANGQRLMVEEVHRVDDIERHLAMEPVTVDGDTARIRFADGVLTCRIARSRQPLRLHGAGG